MIWWGICIPPGGKNVDGRLPSSTYSGTVQLSSRYSVLVLELRKKGGFVHAFLSLGFEQCGLIPWFYIDSPVSVRFLETDVALGTPVFFFQ